jgi:hypothetical protein
MNAKLLVAAVVYFAVVCVLMVLVGKVVGERMFFILFFSHIGALFASWFAYWVLFPAKDRPQLVKLMVLRKVTMARLLLAGVITFTAVLLAVRAFYGSYFSQSGAGQGAFYTGFVFTSLPLLLPAVFWGLYSLSGRLFGVQPKSVTAAKSKTGSISVKASSNVLFLGVKRVTYARESSDAVFFRVSIA